MKLILTHEVTGLGAAGDVIEVKDGYGRNYLLPRGLATPWTKGGQKQVDALTKGREVREIKDVEQAKSVKGRIEATPVKVAAKAGQSGRLFGAVSNGDIADAVKAAGGPELDKRKIEVKQAIKTLGNYEATVRLHAEVAATLKFEVVSA
jgi:large subunit ribosomal protein L9